MGMANMKVKLAMVVVLLLLAIPLTFGPDLSDFVDEIKTNTKTAADATVGWMWQPGSCDDPWAASGQALGIGMTSMLAPSLIVVLTVVMFTMLVYMLGVLLQLPNLIAMAKEELWQSAWTVIRVAFLFGCIMAGNTLFSSAYPNITTEAEQKGIYQGSPSAQHIDLAMTFSKNMVYEMSENIGFLLIYNTIIHTIYSATMWVGITWRSMWSFNLGPVLKPLIDIVGMALQFLFVAVGEWILHIVSLCAIKKWGWSLFIPLALLIRSFPLTRGGGDALLALFFSFALIYPIMFLVDAEVYRVTRSYLVDGTGVLSSFTGGILGSVGLLAIVMMLLGGAFVPFMLNGAVAVAFALIKNAIYFIVIMGFMLPFLNIFVTLTAARETAKIFGVDVNFMSFANLV